MLLESLVRKNVLALQPYSSARDEFTSEAEIYLDANENPFNWQYNRYPDPYQKVLKNVISSWKNIAVDQIFLGNGSDEIIDLLIRAFCQPGLDKVVSLHPSYGMYKVSADINQVDIEYFPLDHNFQLDVDGLIKFVQRGVKIVFICSPNNPSGNLFDHEVIEKICHSFDGLVVVDEAYIDFASGQSMTKILHRFPNLVVLQTLSKAMGAAGIRLGMGFMDPFCVKILNKIKPPYNINSATQRIAYDLITNREEKLRQLSQILEEKALLYKSLGTLPFVQQIFPSEANFILARVKDADHLYHYLLEKGIVVRNRNKQFRCEECIRFTIGTPDENALLVKALNDYLNTH